MKGSQLTFAREYRGYTQKDLVDNIVGLSQSNLSNFEHGLGKLSEHLVKKIMDFLKFPSQFLDLSIVDYVENKHYRTKSTVTVKNKKQIDKFTSLVGYCFDCLAEYVELPEYKFGDYDLNEMGIAASDVAKQVRRQFRLGYEPLMDIYKFLETNGVFVYQWDCPYPTFDGVSMVTGNGYHLVIVNNNVSNDRIRRSLAHELGHTMMHECPSIFVDPNRNKEAEADEFASELLMPMAAIRDSLYGLKPSKLPLLKQYWLVSMTSLIVRAERIGCIDKKKEKNMMIEASRNHWRTKEPIEVPIDSPSVISQILNLVKQEYGYELDTLAKTMELPVDIVNDVLGSKSKIIRLRERM